MAEAGFFVPKKRAGEPTRFMSRGAPDVSEVAADIRRQAQEDAKKEQAQLQASADRAAADAQRFQIQEVEKPTQDIRAQRQKELDELLAKSVDKPEIGKTQTIVDGNKAITYRFVGGRRIKTRKLSPNQVSSMLASGNYIDVGLGRLQRVDKVKLKEDTLRSDGSRIVQNYTLVGKGNNKSNVISSITDTKTGLTRINRYSSRGRFQGETFKDLTTGQTVSRTESKIMVDGQLTGEFKASQAPSKKFLQVKDTKTGKVSFVEKGTPEAEKILFEQEREKARFQQTVDLLGRQQAKRFDAAGVAVVDTGKILETTSTGGLKQVGDRITLKTVRDPTTLAKIDSGELRIPGVERTIKGPTVSKTQTEQRIRQALTDQQIAKEGLLFTPTTFTPARKVEDVDVTTLGPRIIKETPSLDLTPRGTSPFALSTGFVPKTDEQVAALASQRQTVPTQLDGPSAFDKYLASVRTGPFPSVGAASEITTVSPPPDITPLGFQGTFVPGITTTTTPTFQVPEGILGVQGIEDVKTRLNVKNLQSRADQITTRNEQLNKRLTDIEIYQSLNPDDIEGANKQIKTYNKEVQKLQRDADKLNQDIKDYEKLPEATKIAVLRDEQRAEILTAKQRFETAKKIGQDKETIEELKEDYYEARSEYRPRDLALFTGEPKGRPLKQINNDIEKQEKEIERLKNQKAGFSKIEGARQKLRQLENEKLKEESIIQSRIFQESGEGKPFPIEFGIKTVGKVLERPERVAGAVALGAAVPAVIAAATPALGALAATGTAGAVAATGIKGAAIVGGVGLAGFETVKAVEKVATADDKVGAAAEVTVDWGAMLGGYGIGKRFFLGKTTLGKGEAVFKQKSVIETTGPIDKIPLKEIPRTQDVLIKQNVKVERFGKVTDTIRTTKIQPDGTIIQTQKIGNTITRITQKPGEKFSITEIIKTDPKKGTSKITSTRKTKGIQDETVDVIESALETKRKTTKEIVESTDIGGSKALRENIERTIGSQKLKVGGKVIDTTLQRGLARRQIAESFPTQTKKEVSVLDIVQKVGGEKTTTQRKIPLEFTTEPTVLEFGDGKSQVTGLFTKQGKIIKQADLEFDEFGNVIKVSKKISRPIESKFVPEIASKLEIIDIYKLEFGAPRKLTLKEKIAYLKERIEPVFQNLLQRLKKINFKKKKPVDVYNQELQRVKNLDIYQQASPELKRSLENRVYKNTLKTAKEKGASNTDLAELRKTQQPTQPKIKSLTPPTKQVPTKQAQIPKELIDTSRRVGDETVTVTDTALSRFDTRPSQISQTGTGTSLETIPRTTTQIKTPTTTLKIPRTQFTSPSPPKLPTQLISGRFGTPLKSPSRFRPVAQFGFGAALTGGRGVIGPSTSARPLTLQDVITRPATTTQPITLLDPISKTDTQTTIESIPDTTITPPPRRPITPPPGITTPGLPRIPGTPPIKVPPLIPGGFGSLPGGFTDYKKSSREKAWIVTNPIADYASAFFGKQRAKSLGLSKGETALKKVAEAQPGFDVGNQFFASFGAGNGKKDLSKFI